MECFVTFAIIVVVFIVLCSMLLLSVYFVLSECVCNFKRLLKVHSSTVHYRDSGIKVQSHWMLCFMCVPLHLLFTVIPFLSDRDSHSLWCFLTKSRFCLNKDRRSAQSLSFKWQRDVWDFGSVIIRVQEFYKSLTFCSVHILFSVC